MKQVSLKTYLPHAFALFLVILYLFHPNADHIGGLFGIYWADEGAYLLTAKNQVLFGTPHIITDESWRPELISPLVHYVATLTMTQNDVVTGVRISVMLSVLAGISIISHIALKLHKTHMHALACFICVSLGPVLFFYSRVGLAEGLQFLCLAIIIHLLYLLYNANPNRFPMHTTGMLGIMVSILFIAKISAVGACVGTVAGIYMSSAQYPHKERMKLIIFTALCASLTLLVYVAFLIPGTWQQWWASNIIGQVINKVTLEPLEAGYKIILKFIEIPYFLCLMPLFCLYFMSLPMAMDKRRGFIFALAVMTLVTILVETIFGGSIRRNFFGLTLLTILSGFICVEYLTRGIGCNIKTLSKLQWVAIALLLLHIIGAGWLLFRSLMLRDTTYIIFTIIFLIVAIAVCSASFYEHHRRLRILLVGTLSLFSLVPMIYQSFYSPFTRWEASRAIEELVPPDGVIIGPEAPWMLTGVKRKFVLTDCIGPGFMVNYSNNINMLLLEGPTFYTSYWPTLYDDPCAPADTEHYKALMDFVMFTPQNFGVLRKDSKQWQYHNHQYIYEKIR